MRLKDLLLVAVAVVLGPALARGQTADQHFTNGTNFLAQQTMSGLTSAHNSFLSAVTISPAHEKANAMLAVTRLLTLVSTSPGSDFLTTLGFPASGRDIYHWTSSLPEDADGIVAPGGVKVADIPAHLRTNVLSAIQAAQANLANVTSSSFLLELGGDVTTFSPVTIDKGDVLMIRAILHFFEYFIYTGKSWNLNVLFSDLRTMNLNGSLTAENLLATYPQLFNFATTEDLNAAKTAFQNFKARYDEASAFIRARPTQEDRLFMYDSADGGMVDQEANFRDVIAALNTSLSSGATVLPTDSSLMVNASKHFDGSSTLRSLLPQFSGDRFIIGTFPDTTFGGLVTGLNVNGIEETVLRAVDGAVRIQQPSAPVNNLLQIQFTGIAGRDYEVLASPDLVNWFVLTNFTAESRNISFQIPTGEFSYGFLRIVSRDMEGGMGFDSFHSVIFDPNLDVTACAGTPTSYCCMPVTPDGSGNFANTWPTPQSPVVNVTGTITPTTFGATVNCSSGGALTTLSANWTGSFYQGNQGSGRLYVTDQNNKVYLQGRVTQMDGTTPISGATVSTSLDGVQATTDSGGYFFLLTGTTANFSSTPYTVTVTKAGFVTFNSTAPWGDHPTGQRIALQPSP